MSAAKLAENLHNAPEFREQRKLEAVDAAGWGDSEHADHDHGLEWIELARIGFVALAAAAVWLRVWEPFSRVSLPKLFFIHSCPTSFVVEQDGLIIGFVLALVSQSYPDEGYIHFVGVHPNSREGG